MNIEILSITPNAEQLIEQAGRTCYQSTIGNPSIIRAWIKAGHESVVEHASATFRISEISRACSHQLVRHRLASYSQQSQRYVEDGDFDYVMPQSIAMDKFMSQEYLRMMSYIKMMYKDFIGNGIKKEDARMILPNACHTEIVMTANMREWRSILKLRCDKHAQWEIREMATDILLSLAIQCPNVFADLAELYL